MSWPRWGAWINVLTAHRDGQVPSIRSRRIGPALVFGRLWEELRIPEVIQRLLAGRRYELPLERLLFLTVLHRLFASGNDRSCVLVWKQDFDIPGLETVALHQVYRAMAWLGEQLPAEEQTGATPFSPRCIKDAFEEALFDRRRDLFSNLDLVFFDTTSISFEGEGGATLGQYGHSKDHRPDCKQIVVGAVLDSEGRPLCCELWPGNVTDVKTLIPIVERLQKRFRIRSICIVADRGMISQETIAQLQLPERKVHFIQAKKDHADRDAIVAALRKQLKQGDKALVGNKGYRKYLRARGPSFEIDEAKIKEQVRFDGKWVLLTDLDDRTAEEIALQYQQLWIVEETFRAAKTLLETRPIFHNCDATFRGHVFCSFLALLLRAELQRRLEAQGSTIEWARMLRDLEALQCTEVACDQQRFLLRSDLRGDCAAAFRAAGVAIPPNVQKVTE